MEPLQILERYYNAFIGQDNLRDFFIGFCDYLDYAETVPEFDWITSDVSAQPQPLFKQLAEQEAIALKRLDEIKAKLQVYISKNKIEDKVVLSALEEYEGHKSGHIQSSMSLPYALHFKLRDVVEFLYRMHEHQKFATRYIEFLDDEKTRVRRYLPIKEVDAFLETRKEVERGGKFDIWGQQQKLYRLYDIIRKGRERHKKLVERDQNEIGVGFQLLNLGVILGEWISIEDGIPRNQDPVFFSVKKVRPAAQRFHTYVLSRFTEAREAIAVVKSEPNISEKVEKKEVISIDVVSHKPALIKDNKQGYLKFYKEGPRILIGKVDTRKYRLVEVLFDPLGVAKSIEVVFEAIRDPKDEADGRLKGEYTAPTRQRELIDYAMKELQKIKGLKGRISLVYHHGKSTVALKIG